ncbi:uncharacterized protein LOC144468341 [Augochlora pura]
MAREVLQRLNICSLALIVSAFHRASSTAASPVDCTRFDIAELEDYLSKVRPGDPAWTDTMIGKFASTSTEPPFGALKSDWPRLLLLQRAQPEGSILREKLGRLFRILAVAYSETVAPSDITEPVFSTGNRWDAITDDSTVHFVDSTKTSKIIENSTPITALPDLKESRHTTEIGQTTLATSNGTKSYIRSDLSTFMDTVAPTPFDATTFATIAVSTTQTPSNQNSTHSFNIFDKNDDPGTNTIYEDPPLTYKSRAQEINGAKFATPPFDATIATFATRSSENTTEAERSPVDVKVAAADEKSSADPPNKRQGIKMTGEGDGSRDDHFRGGEQIGGFVAGKSSVAGVVARPITSPVSETDTPFTPVGSDFSSSRDPGPGTTSVELAEGIKELDSVRKAGAEIAGADPGRAGAGGDDSGAVYAAVNSEDQENTAGGRVVGYRVNTSDPEMLPVKTTSGPSRVHTDRIRGNEVPGTDDDDFRGRLPVYREDGGHAAPGTSPRTVQNSDVYGGQIRKPSSISDIEFSSSTVIPRVAGSAIPSDRPDQWRDNWRRTGPIKSKKRGSLNTNLEKTFRWFYNVGGDRDSKQRGIRVECNGTATGIDQQS